MTTMVEKLASALLYEGYMLYPYRPSSVKNRQRFNFGVLHPESCRDVRSGTERATMQTEVLVRGGPDTRVRARVRFLQLVERVADAPDGAPWQEAIEREVLAVDAPLAEVVAGPVSTTVTYAASDAVAPAGDPGAVASGVARRQAEIDGAIETRAVALDARTFRVSVQVTNRTPMPPDETRREQVLMQAMVSTHTILDVEGGVFVSALDPPADLRDAAAACENTGCWPVLVGAEGECTTMLASPIILYDHPQIAPESPGDLFDGTEIDEILSLRILTLTDDEKQEMSHADERARRLLERTESMTAEQWMKLHGVLRPGGAEGVP
jgi:hypothetical protein